MVRDSMMGKLSFLAVTFGALLLLIVLIRKLLNNFDTKYVNLICLTVLLCYPLLCTLERGNSILYVIDLILIFLVYYESENKYCRIIAYLALAMAVGFKIWPVFFGLLLLRKRQYRES